MKRISIGTWAYNIGPYEQTPIPFETVGGTLAQLGFDGLELGGFNGYPNPHLLPTMDQRDELKATMQGWGLAFSGFAADLWSQHLIDTDDQSAYLDEFTRNADFARELGIKGIRVDTVQPPTILDQVDADTAFQRVVENWKTAARIAADRGLYVTWEIEPGFCFNKASEIQRVLDAIPDRNFGVMYDTCHGQMIAVVGARHQGEKETLKGGQLELIEKLSGRINHIHLIDSDNSCHKDADGNDETSAHPPFGDGVIDFDSLVPRLVKEDVGHDWWTIDLCFYQDAWTVTERCKASLDTLNEQYGGHTTS
ncbi:MAG: sugar phosphate isomerase/epimerase family protein [Geminicoccaceae bacterium]